MSSGWCDRCVNSECKQCGSLKPDPTPEELRLERKELCERLNDRDATIVGLRRRIHVLEFHVMPFDTCESAWCNPVEGVNPAINFHILSAETAEPIPVEAAMAKAIADRDGAD
jgi:hypothetical protein